ncbi:voltage dependent anion channel [Tribonema minus]|uniref:Voltage dependent anion channel n=1 Tax=Tribonema minus TaxID=303371 RepID=A0A835YZM2_9STRA|nr:voltage dependent anion channel [Tribonema minus]
MVVPPFYKDLTKVVNDLLTDDFSLKRTVKVKHTTPHNVNFTIENEHKGSAVAGKVQLKYAHKPSGFALDKVTIAQNGAKTVECSLAGLAPGLKLTAKVDDAIKGDVGAEYVGAGFAIKTDMDVEATKMVTSATAAYEGVNAGGIISAKLPGDKPAALSDYNAGVAYGGTGWFTALTTTNKMATYNLSATYAPAKNVTAVVLASLTPETGAQSVVVGTKYVCNPNTTLRAKATSDGMLHAAVQHKCTQGLIIGAATEVNAKDMQPKFGFNCTLG